MLADASNASKRKRFPDFQLVTSCVVLLVLNIHPRPVVGCPCQILPTCPYEWVSLAKAKRLAIIDVSEFMLDYVAELLKAPAKARFGRPLFAYRHDIPYVRYIGGPAPDGIGDVKDRTGLK